MQITVFELLLAVGLASHIGEAVAKLLSPPKEFLVCPRTNDSCLLQSVQGAIRLFVQGNPKLGMIPLDPLKVNRLVLDTGNGPLGLKLTMTEQDLKGLGGYTVNKAHGEFGASTYRLEISGFAPHISWLGEYDINGKVLVLPIVGSGKNNISIINNDLKFVFTGHVENKDGDDFVLIDDVRLTFNTTRLYMRLDNLFNGDKALGDTMNLFINDNWQEILGYIQVQIEDVVSAIAKDLANRFYSRIPYKSLYLF